MKKIKMYLALLVCACTVLTSSIVDPKKRSDSATQWDYFVFNWAGNIHDKNNWYLIGYDPGCDAFEGEVCVIYCIADGFHPDQSSLWDLSWESQGFTQVYSGVAGDVELSDE